MKSIVYYSDLAQKESMLNENDDITMDKFPMDMNNSANVDDGTEQRDDMKPDMALDTLKDAMDQIVNIIKSALRNVDRNKKDLDQKQDPRNNDHDEAPTIALSGSDTGADQFANQAEA